MGDRHHLPRSEYNGGKCVIPWVTDVKSCELYRACDENISEIKTTEKPMVDDERASMNYASSGVVSIRLHRS